MNTQSTIIEDVDYLSTLIKSKLNYVSVDDNSVTITKQTTKIAALTYLIFLIFVSVLVSITAINLPYSPFTGVFLGALVFSMGYFGHNGLRDKIFPHSTKFDFKNNVIIFRGLFDKIIRIYLTGNSVEIIVETYFGKSFHTELAVRDCVKRRSIIYYDIENNEPHPDAILLANFISTKLNCNIVINTH